MQSFFPSVFIVEESVGSATTFYEFREINTSVIPTMIRSRHCLVLNSANNSAWNTAITTANSSCLGGQ